MALDENGWAVVDDLILGVNLNSKHLLNRMILNEIVASDDKQRYSFNEDQSMIRANQGHSVNVDIKFEEKDPPDILYHGTNAEALDSIYRKGLKSMKRHDVHLSADFDESYRVANRRKNKYPIVLVIAASEMKEKGFVFNLSENKVWLTKKIPSHYIMGIYDLEDRG